MSGEISYAQKVAEIDEVAEKICNDWEQDFLESMMEYGPGDSYTDKQKAVIDKLYEKACQSPY